jgi:hypothetical protein
MLLPSVNQVRLGLGETSSTCPCCPMGLREHTTVFSHFKNFEMQYEVRCSYCGTTRYINNPRIALRPVCERCAAIREIVDRARRHGYTGRDYETWKQSRPRLSGISFRSGGRLVHYKYKPSLSSRENYKIYINDWMLRHNKSWRYPSS